MVFFVISRKGFEVYLAVIEKLSAPLWISAGIISQSELDSLRSRGADVTNFNYEIGLNEHEVIDDAIETIREHHPDEVIWVQR
ncbi:MAG: hypothetical protein ACXWAT_03115 [Methylobacter sp.]